MPINENRDQQFVVDQSIESISFSKSS